MLVSHRRYEGAQGGEDEDPDPDQVYYNAGGAGAGAGADGDTGVDIDPLAYLGADEGVYDTPLAHLDSVALADGGPIDPYPASSSPSLQIPTNRGTDIHAAMHDTLPIVDRARQAGAAEDKRASTL